MRVFEFFRPLSNLHSETASKTTNFDNYRRRSTALFMETPFPAIFADGFGGKGNYLYQNRRIGNEILQDNPHTRRICRLHRNRKRRRYAADGENQERTALLARQQRDKLTDTTYQIHFRLKQGAFIAPNDYFPNTSGIVFGLHYKHWFPWEHHLDYSFSPSPSFENTNKLFLSLSDECSDDDAKIDTAIENAFGTVPDVLLRDGVPVLRVKSYHHES